MEKGGTVMQRTEVCMEPLDLGAVSHTEGVGMRRLPNQRCLEVPEPSLGLEGVANWQPKRRSTPLHARSKNNWSKRLPQSHRALRYTCH